MWPKYGWFLLVSDIAGLKFDLSTCSCESETASSISNNSVAEHRVERSGVTQSTGQRFGQLTVIVALSAVATVFFILIISLLHSINSLKTSIRNMKESTEWRDRGEERNLIQSTE